MESSGEKKGITPATLVRKGGRCLRIRIKREKKEIISRPSSRSRRGKRAFLFFGERDEQLFLVEGYAESQHLCRGRKGTFNPFERDGGRLFEDNGKEGEEGAAEFDEKGGGGGISTTIMKGGERGAGSPHSLEE